MATEFEFGEQIEFDFGEQTEFDLDILRQLALCSLRTVQIPTTSKVRVGTGKSLPARLLPSSFESWKRPKPSQIPAVSSLPL